MKKSLKSTDIPNACIIAGPKDNILIDLDEDGNMSETGTGVKLSGWSEDILVNGLVLPNILVFVHIVRGTEISKMLIRYLTAIRLNSDGKGIKIRDLAKNKTLPAMIHGAWHQYIAEKKESLKKKSKDREKSRCEKN